MERNRIDSPIDDKKAKGKLCHEEMKLRFNTQHAWLTVDLQRVASGILTGRMLDLVWDKLVPAYSYRRDLTNCADSDLDILQRLS